jgi:hypothetical protein
MKNFFTDEYFRKSELLVSFGLHLNYFTKVLDGKNNNSVKIVKII